MGIPVFNYCTLSLSRTHTLILPFPPLIDAVDVFTVVLTPCSGTDFSSARQPLLDGARRLASSEFLRLQRSPCVGLVTSRTASIDRRRCADRQGTVPRRGPPGKLECQFRPAHLAATEPAFGVEKPADVEVESARRGRGRRRWCRRSKVLNVHERQRHRSGAIDLNKAAQAATSRMRTVAERERRRRNGAKPRPLGVLSARQHSWLTLRLVSAADTTAAWPA